MSIRDGRWPNWMMGLTWWCWRWHWYQTGRALVCVNVRKSIWIKISNYNRNKSLSCCSFRFPPISHHLYTSDLFFFSVLFLCLVCPLSAVVVVDHSAFHSPIATQRITLNHFSMQTNTSSVESRRLTWMVFVDVRSVGALCHITLNCFTTFAFLLRAHTVRPTSGKAEEETNRIESNPMWAPTLATHWDHTRPESCIYLIVPRYSHNRHTTQCRAHSTNINDGLWIECITHRHTHDSSSILS